MLRSELFRKNPGNKFMEELWKQIPDFPNYDVSSFGRIRNRTTKKFIKSYRNKHKNYYMSRLYNEDGGYTMYVHRVVAEAFLENGGVCPTCGMKRDINHKDGDGKNNRTDNLEYITHQQNVDHSQEKKTVAQKEWYQRFIKPKGSLYAIVQEAS